ncbi:RNA-binding protein rsd1-like [Aedes aegypti]|uniref:Male determiner protein Nix n=2 Tax=Aedes aegypti TaxID=7159 RepID=NIX_AEDAE|nr:RNA-binding protein rsd1-like [Aedes aegypti]A0A0F6MY85.1 RecName: Full=Male determiner protein Nix [Aedes aegypti]AHW46195.1 NIX protein [Aedes aegypti]ASL04659.1 nix [Aedes aegypti]UTK64184.1 Nix [Cloning vector pTRE-Nix/NixPro-tTA]
MCKKRNAEINAEFDIIKKYCIYIGNIPFFASKNDVVVKFAEYGETCNIYMQSNKPHCDVKPAIVRYRSRKSVDKSLCLNNSKFGNTILIVLPLSLPYSRYLLTYDTCIVVYINDKNSCKTSMAELYDEFQKIGDIQNMFKTTNNMIYINFESEKSMQLSLATKPFLINNNIFKIKKVERNINMCGLNSESQDFSTNLKKKLLYNRSIGIFGLPSNATEERIAQIFSRFGDIQKITLICDVVGNSKQYGFIYYKKRTSANAAKVIMDGENFEGNKISVRFVPEKKVFKN